MKKLTTLLISALLLAGAAACQSDVAQTNTAAPDTTEETIGTPAAEEAREGQEDATSEVRRDQLNSDIRAREERDQALGNDDVRADADLAREIASKLEANLPASLLTVEAEEGVVTVAGTVPTQEQYERIEPLAREIRGVQNVDIQAKVQPAQPQGNN
ncbi:MAG: BON domain-containing protein [Kastovskya adunca ATA6-11-RM4]|jgi:uncharacterized membrane protein|nr:BON domain-containing protein [Kastovskya adunca ATA6-11-RM4]